MNQRTMKYNSEVVNLIHGACFPTPAEAAQETINGWSRAFVEKETNMSNYIASDGGIYNFDDEIVKPYTVRYHFYHQPFERQENFYPGCPESFTLEDVSIEIEGVSAAFKEELARLIYKSITSEKRNQLESKRLGLEEERRAA